jgi:peroxiredoxin
MIWMRVVVAIAAAFHAYAALFGPDPIELRSVWAAMAIGLTIAAVNPLRSWLLILTILLARALSAVASASATNAVLSSFGWLPLGFVLAAAYRDRLKRLRGRAPEILDFALRARTSHGTNLDILSRCRPVLLVFLRHAGCTFCREAAADLARQREEIQRAGAVIVVAHMSETEAGRQFLAHYDLEDVHQISDPTCCLYKAFGLRRGTLQMLFGPKVWLRGFQAGILNGHGVGRLVGDGFQMPGIFMIFHGQVIRSYRHQSAADRPDYLRFVTEDAFTGMVS